MIESDSLKMYISNPFMGKVRRLAVNDCLYHGYNKSQAARKYGVHRATIGKWIKRASADHREFICTGSSRPLSHPDQLSNEVIEKIIELRLELGRCAPVIHKHMVLEGYKVSLSSVGRVLFRYGLTRKKKQARWGKRIKRPASNEPGDLVQMDTIHITRNDYSRFFIYTVLDTFSRIGFAKYQINLKQEISLSVVSEATNYFGFNPKVIQTDNGPEFRSGFECNLGYQHIKVRHSRVRRPNDNAHIERFNRTIQEECFKSKYPREDNIQNRLDSYIEYYNNKRLHLSLDLMTPRQFVAKVLN